MYCIGIGTVFSLSKDFLLKIKQLLIEMGGI